MSENFICSIGLMNLSLLSLLPQTNKRKKIQIQSFYLMSMIALQETKTLPTTTLKNLSKFSPIKGEQSR